MKTIAYFFLIQLCFFARAQYPPAAGQPGSTAIASDSSCFIDWASGCTVHRGFINIADTTVYASSSNRASYGTEADVAGVADNGVVSLGDAGVADIFFNVPLSDGPGYDAAVFENPLSDTYLELAFVDISSDGIHFFRIPAYSLTDTTLQTGGFGTTDPTQIHNLAGKYRALYGTPFDIAEAPDTNLLRKDSVTVVRLTDVVGSIDPLFASRDCEGRIINDPYPTPFESCGFDLDAVGVIHNRTNTGFSTTEASWRVYPNPASDVIYIDVEQSGILRLYSAAGRMVREYSGEKSDLSVSGLDSGLYFLRSESGGVIQIIILQK